MNIEELTDKTAVLNSLEILIGERVIKNPRMNRRGGSLMAFPFTIMSKRYIGRTSAYYDDDDNYVFTPDLWTDSDDPSDLAGEVHELTESGAKLLDDYYWDLGAGYDLCYGKAQGLADRFSREQMWEHLTDPTNGYSIKIEQQ